MLINRKIWLGSREVILKVIKGALISAEGVSYDLGIKSFFFGNQMVQIRDACFKFACLITCGMDRYFMVLVGLLKLI